MLCGIIVTAALCVHSTQAQTEPSSQSAEANRHAVARLGIGQQARTEIKLRDNRKVKGYVSDTGPDSFTVIDHKTGAPQTIAYADVATVKQPHGGLKLRTWIIIAGAAAAAVIVGVTVVKPVLCDGC
jgi:hypothetical protein